jgi:two-component system, chemotaxis family, chemotaxis protein CheY
MRVDIPTRRALLPCSPPATSLKVLAPRERSTIVMTVDDDADLQLSIVDGLEDKGFCPVVAGDGLEALDLLRGGFRPSVILLDLRMPRMDGWNFRREQTKDVALRDIPVVVTTAEPLSESAKKAQFGEVGWLPKPFGFDALVTAIENALLPARDSDGHLVNKGVNQAGEATDRR